MFSSVLYCFNIILQQSNSALFLKWIDQHPVELVHGSQNVHAILVQVEFDVCSNLQCGQPKILASQSTRALDRMGHRYGYHTKALSPLSTPSKVASSSWQLDILAFIRRSFTILSCSMWLVLIFGIYIESMACRYACCQTIHDHKWPMGICAENHHHVHSIFETWQ